MTNSRPPGSLQCKISENELAGCVVSILTGKLAPRQYKSGKWYLDLGPVAVESDELPHYNTLGLVDLAQKALEPHVVEDEWEEESSESEPPPDPTYVFFDPESAAELAARFNIDLKHTFPEQDLDEGGPPKKSQRTKPPAIAPTEHKQHLTRHPHAANFAAAVREAIAVGSLLDAALAYAKSPNAIPIQPASSSKAFQAPAASTRRPAIPSSSRAGGRKIRAR
jgi:hypothetical protein